MTVTPQPVGQLVRRWREHRRRSQLDVSTAAGLSARHLSFIETGRANPSRDMIERLCDEFDVPLRERNSFYLAAGYAPPYAERPLADLGIARTAIEAVLRGHEPNPAMAINVRWDLLAANQPMQRLLDRLAPALPQQPVNVLRAMLHPDGLAKQVRNYAQWRADTLRRVRRQLDRTGAEGLAELLDELQSYPAPSTPYQTDAGTIARNDLVTPVVLATDQGDLSLHHALTVFGAARDVTLDEIAIETFFPADEQSATLLRSW
ncbi:helix-turn-helix domain-containing protein [Actinocatenispora sera]|jgi:transcriptional regulator with XRE-family HTH domain|uniref:Transcriptional regulator n=1 Tax=Actinocatenispora sera TaxID=390989 RepID=A0A810L1Q4_9ACTN|nr:helix-turn-helix transcriptional regulator [Actinocatenispora sera]BCJ28582.1 transcriptional regulator [Actinocatenispora sera]